MSINSRLREQIDACRQGTDDLALPELADLAHAVEHSPSLAEELARSERFDGAIHAALHDLPVPAHLAERLLAAARADQPIPAVTLPTKSARQLRITRRKALFAAGSLAAIALIALSTYQWLKPRRLIPQGELAAAVTDWLATLPPKGWSALSGTAKLPGGTDIDPAVIGQPRQWQRLASSSVRGWSAKITAIDLASADQPRAILFIVKSSARFAVPATPTTTTRLSLSRGFSAAAWQRHGSNLLYILVVEEKRNQRLEHFLQGRPQA
jgi:hypothetical protein